MEFVQSYYTNKGGHRKSNQDSLAIVKAALQSGETLLAPVRQFVAEHCFVRDAALLPEIRAAQLGADAGIIGAAMLGGCA